jgi:hypothetical protein
MTTIKSSSSVPFTPITAQQPTAVEVAQSSAAGPQTNPVSAEKGPGPVGIDGGRQMSESFLAGNLRATQLNAQFDHAASIQNSVSAELSLPADQRPDVMQLPNVSATVQGNSLTMTGDMAELSLFFMNAAIQGKPLPSLMLELPMLNENGMPIGTQTVRLSNALVSSFETIDGGDRPAQKVSVQFDKIEYL